MVFSTHIFIFYFLPLTLALYYGLGELARAVGASDGTVSALRNTLLLVASYVFYGWWNPWFILLMAAMTVVNYVCGALIARPGASPSLRYRALVASVVISLGTLGFFKYLGFLEVNLNSLLALLGAPGVRVLEIVLPMGISFYTFQALSYSVDVYRGDAPRARSLLDFAAYIALYPQLVAGPIVRYSSVAEQLVRRSHTWDMLARGAALFILGLAKKILLANPAGQIADAAFAAPALAAPDAWFGVLAYAFQIYFDFSGYSDMAVGLGRMIGFEFIRNFDDPYHADSITDFWRRWHISLSTFLRDYLYIPLGGNRRGPWRTYVNLTIVMLLGGLWHGASWTFIAWGAYHGLLLAIERAIGKQSLYHRLPRPMRLGATFILILFSWVLFRAASLPEAGAYFSAMLGRVQPSPSDLLLAGALYSPARIFMLAACAACLLIPAQAHDWVDHLTWPKALVLVPAFCLAILIMLAQAFSPFLYFQF